MAHPKLSKFSKILEAERVSVSQICRHAKEKFGLKLDPNIVSNVVSHRTDFRIGTIDSVLIVFNDLTGKDYTLDQVHNTFDFR